MPITFTLDAEPLEPVDPDYCECGETTGWTLVVEEGGASLLHSCGKPSWLYPEDIWIEVPVTLDVTTCDNPGGWHGMERCDCGPEVIIEPRTVAP